MHRLLGDGYTSAIVLRYLTHGRPDPSVGHASGKSQGLVRRFLHFSSPVFLQNAPEPLYRFVFAVIGRIVSQLYGDAMGIG